MIKEFSAAEYTDLEVSFLYNDEANNQWPLIWKLHPEKVVLVKLDSCVICEITANPQMKEATIGFKAHMESTGMLKNGTCVGIRLSEKNNQYFIPFSLEVSEPGVLLCAALQDEINLNSASGKEKNYSDEEKAFFSKFRKENT